MKNLALVGVALFSASSALALPPRQLPGLSIGLALHAGQRAYEYFERARARDFSVLATELEIRDAKGNTLPNEPIAEPWHLLAPESDGAEGTRTEKAHRELGLRAPDEPVLVAVIDTGMDITHPDLDGRIAPGGWNFLGTPDGRKVEETSNEASRELGRMRKLEDLRSLTPAELAYLKELESEHDRAVELQESKIAALKMRLAEVTTALDALRALGLREVSEHAIRELPEPLFAQDPAARAARDLALKLLAAGATPARLNRSLYRAGIVLNYHLNPKLDPSDVLGDDSTRFDLLNYGNTDLVSHAYDHATHIAGVIAGIRDNGIGINGHSDWARILPIRAIPDGDERDKDVVAAVRYAIDHGAKILSLSFGKTRSPHKAEVDRIFIEAERRGLLVVHSAGNESTDTDVIEYFPNRRVTDPMTGKIRELANWIDVGASDRNRSNRLAATFSNYGRTRVDLFAPGEQIVSLLPDGKIGAKSGTSMAVPQVSGIAALIWSQYPRLTAAELRLLLVGQVRRYPGLQVLVPGSLSIHTDFANLSSSGGVIDAYSTLTAAREWASGQRALSSGLISK